MLLARFVICHLSFASRLGYWLLAIGYWLLAISRSGLLAIREANRLRGGA
jgi:hypothetical protein